MKKRNETKKREKNVILQKKDRVMLEFEQIEKN